MAGTLPTQLPVFLLKQFHYITVPDIGSGERNTQLSETILYCQIGHECSHHPTLKQPPLLTMSCNDVDQLIPIIDRALAIHHDDTVAVTIQRDAKISVMLPNGYLQC